MAIAVSSFCAMVESQEGGTYEEMLRLLGRAEALGFGGFDRSDHYHPMNVPLSSDSTDAWAILAGLARDTSTIRLGELKCVGCTRWYFQLVPVDDGGMLEIIVNDLAPKCG